MWCILLSKWVTRDRIAIAFQPHFRYAIRKVQENQRRLEFNGTCLHLVYANDANLLDKKIINANIVDLLDARKEDWFRRKHKEN
jgi:hypothetical protein